MWPSLRVGERMLRILTKAGPKARERVRRRCCGGGRVVRWSFPMWSHMPDLVRVGCFPQQRASYVPQNAASASWRMPGQHGGSAEWSQAMCQ